MFYLHAHAKRHNVRCFYVFFEMESKVKEIFAFLKQENLKKK